MIVSIKHLSYGHIQDRVDWLEKNVGERKYVLHTQSGGHGWKYHNNDRTIEIEDEKMGLLFVLRWGG